MRQQFNMLVWVQVHNTIKLNFDSQTQVLVLIYQDSERNGNHLIQNRSIGDFKKKLKKDKPKSQGSYHKRNFILKLLFVFFWPCLETNKKIQRQKECNRSFYNKQRIFEYYSTTLSIRGKVSTTLIKLLKDLSDVLAPLQQWLYYSLLYKDMNNWRIIIDFYHFTNSNTLSNSKVHHA
jgi:hypothetical protein